MYEIEVTRHFSAAHRLAGYPGPCANLHGHNWLVTVYLSATQLNEIGISVDFKVLKREMDACFDHYDHALLNELPEFEAMNPTSENLARQLYADLAARVNSECVKLTRVKVSESEGSSASYFE